jgi:hypothetical protein
VMNGRGICENHGVWKLDGHDCPGCELDNLRADLRPAWADALKSRALCEEYRLKGLARIQSLEGDLRGARHLQKDAERVLCEDYERWANERAALRDDLRACAEALDFISHGHTIPGYKGESSDPLLALAQEVIDGAQRTARAALARPGVKEDEATGTSGTMGHG